MRADGGRVIKIALPARCGIWFRAAAWFAVLALIIIASLVPSGLAPEEIPSVIWNVGHAPAYALLTLLSLWLVQRESECRPGRTVLIALGVFVLGVVLEWLQPLFGRHADLGDVGANAVGIVIAVSAWSLVASTTGRRWIERAQSGCRQR